MKTMILKKYFELEAVFFILLGATAGFILLTAQTSRTNYQAHAQNVSTLPSELQNLPLVAVNPTLTPTPTPTLAPLPSPTIPPVTPHLEQVVTAIAGTTTSQISSDGTKKVVLNIIPNKNGNQTYTIAIDNGPVIFSKTFEPNNSISIPYNTWSPDNRYFFLQENTGTQTNIMVFNADGSSFANGNAYLDLTGVFRNQVSTYTFDEATGWADNNLIIINTKLADNTQGPSYWFSVPDAGIIQLATKF